MQAERMNLWCTFRQSSGEAFAFGPFVWRVRQASSTAQRGPHPLAASIRICASLSHQILTGITLRMGLPSMALPRTNQTHGQRESLADVIWGCMDHRNERD